MFVSWDVVLILTFDIIDAFEKKLGFKFNPQNLSNWFSSHDVPSTSPLAMVYKLILLQASWYHTSALIQVISTNLHNKNHLLETKNLANCTYYKYFEL